MLTLKEAAEVLRLHPRTVRAYVRLGVLEGRVIGRQWRFHPQALTAFYESAPRQWEWPASEKAEDSGD